MAGEDRRVSIRLQRAVELFLCEHYKPGTPLLLGFSGGYDSRALFELLLASRRRHEHTLLVAHVDHGWREESAGEALALKKMVESRGIPFYLHTSSIKKEGNLEDHARRERLRFFENLYQEHKCQALILAHQADDQAETLLKRFFEGAHFTSLGAMRPTSMFGSMNVWRPLLDHSKDEILRFLEKLGINALHDRTNFDPQFLRARMRSDLIPLLERTFGKNIRDNLIEFAKNFQELSTYFLEKSSGYLASRQKTLEGASLDFSQHPSFSSLEVEVALKLFLQEEGVVVGTRHLRQLVGQLMGNESKKRLYLQNKIVIVDKRKVIVVLEENN